MTKDFLSIIIPVYNTAPLFHRLMEQLKPQAEDHPNCEIIVVDDGSTDEDLSWVSDYPRVIFRRQENCGAASARNVGLELAHGEYITFIDSDDQIYPDYMDIVLENHRAGYDWVSYAWNGDGKLVTWHNNDPLMVNCGCCMYSFRSDLIGDERFNERYNVREDQEWMLRVLRDDCKHKHDRRVIYNYTWEGNDTSLSHRYLYGALNEMRD